MKIVIGTRGSNLALKQTRLVEAMLKNLDPSLETEINIIKTKGDKVLDKSISKIGGKEIFIKEIEKDLLDGTIDMAVHSMKDMPGVLPEGLIISSIPEREDPRDVLVTRDKIASIYDLPWGARIGTGSKRRAIQLRDMRPDLEIVPIRGNVETRIGKIETEGLDGVALAASGIHRLGLEIENLLYLGLDQVLPSPGQGILAIESREDDKALNSLLQDLTHQESQTQAEMERDFLQEVGGSCSVPVGAYADIDGDRIVFRAVLGDEEGRLERICLEGGLEDRLGLEAGQRLRERFEKKKGRVYLVGAGPGDPELLTLKAKWALEEADLIVYDRLANPSLLDINPGAEKIYAGKKAAQHHLTQDETNNLLYREAAKGRTVARLKGGDPFVFGRGGEEGLYLRERGIDFEVIPGISSAIGGLAYAGIPISHRDLATSFHVITGHTREDDDLDYENLAGLRGTLVFLMGLKNLERIREGLIDSGKDPKTPVALIQWASTSRQRVLVSDLENIVRDKEKSTIDTPAIIVVGEVVGLRKDLNFYERLPLFGHNVVITREAKAAGPTIDKFQSLGANVISLPMIRTNFTWSEDLDRAIEEIEDYSYIYFTSVNGVRFFMDYFIEESDIRRLGGVKFCTIGSKTQGALASYGIKSEFTPDHFEGLEAVDLLKDYVKEGDRVLVPRASLGRHEIVDELKAYCKLTEVPIYDTLASQADKDQIQARLKAYDQLDLVFTSSSTFKNFHKALGEGFADLASKSRIISIGPITTKTIEEAGYKVDIEAEEYTIDGIIRALKEDKIDL